MNAFLTSSGRLGDAIGRRELVGLNPIADTWTRDKQSVLAVCATYLPTPPGLARPRPVHAHPDSPAAREFMNSCRCTIVECITLSQ